MKKYILCLSFFSHIDFVHAMEEIAMSERDQSRIEELYKRCVSAIKHNDSAHLDRILRREDQSIACKAIEGNFTFSDARESEALTESLFTKVEDKKKSWTPTMVRLAQAIGSVGLLYTTIYDASCIVDEGNTFLEGSMNAIGSLASFMGLGYLCEQIISNTAHESYDISCKLMKAILKAKLSNGNNQESTHDTDVDPQHIKRFYNYCCNAIAECNSKKLELFLKSVEDQAPAIIAFNPQEDSNENERLHNNLSRVLKDKKNKPRYKVRIVHGLLALGMGANFVYNIIDQLQEEKDHPSVEEKVARTFAMEGNSLGFFYFLHQALNNSHNNAIAKKYELMKKILQKYGHQR